MRMKFTFLFQYHEETQDTDEYVKFLQSRIIPKILQVDGVSNIELCNFVPFSLANQNGIELSEQKHLLQMDIFYENEYDFQRAMGAFSDSFLVEEIIKAEQYTDLYISNIQKFTREVRSYYKDSYTREY